MLNPLLIKEFRMQMRGRESYAVGTIYLLSLSALAFSMFWEASTGQRALDAEYGREMFIAFTIALVLALCLICPAFTVGAISSEKERLTFEQLRVTLLSPHQLLAGKAAPSLIYTLILLVASLPVATLVMPTGGISLRELASCYLIAFISSTAFSLTGLMWSSMYRNTRSATVMTYTITGFFTFGTAMVPIILSGTFRMKVNRTLVDLFIALNPFHAVISVFGRGRNFQLAGLSPWVIAIAGYLIVSIISVSISLVRFKTMRN